MSNLKALIQIIVLHSIKINFLFIAYNHYPYKDKKKPIKSNIACALSSSLEEWKTLCNLNLYLAW